MIIFNTKKSKKSKNEQSQIYNKPHSICLMNKIKKILRIANYFIDAAKYIVLTPIALTVYRHRQIYIFAERGTDARDNGYYMFRFYREKHPEIEAYYVIDKKSSDYKKVEKSGNVINYGSLEHYLIFIASEYMISTHIMGYSPNIDFFSRFSDKLHLKGHRIFLQHGVISNDLPALYSTKTNLKIFICGAKPEYDYINKTFGYSNDEVKYTGLARYDGLHNTKLKNQILCMPTWRKFLKYDQSVAIENSEYVNKWNSLINHPQILSALKEKNLKLIFYPHYELQPYISVFNSESENVVIADFNSFDVQQLLKESQLLITDYSSVFFDFAYMQKPCVYYQFDKKMYYNSHYAKGYFDYELMGFGEVVEKEQDAVEVILSYIDNQFQMKSDYKQRINNFFPLHDTQNCQRIFDEINKL